MLKVNDNILESSDDICDGWATHFQMLANNLENENFDEQLKSTFEDDVNHIKLLCERLNTDIFPIQESEINVCVKKT